MAPGRTSEKYSSLTEKISHLGIEDISSKLWELKSIPGKDLGLIATTDISPGTLLLSEAPLVTTNVITSLTPEGTERDLITALSKLPVKSQKAYRSLHNNFATQEPDTPLLGILRSNGYPLGASAEAGGVFADISRINHSCLPNAVQYWNPLLEKQTIYAVRKIPTGGEILTMYSDDVGVSEERKKALKERFEFDCTCEICALEPAELAESDARFRRAKELDAIIGSAEKMYYQPEEVMRSCRELYHIYEKEGFKDGRVSRLYWDLFQLCNMHGDLARARCFAKYYSDTKKVAEGADSMNVLEVKPFIKSPQKHGSYEPNGKWKTGTVDVPKGLSAKEFARWLWREAV